MEKVITYIDGFNLYYGMSSIYGKKYLWLDLNSLSCKFLKPGQTLEKIHYFTARIKHPNQKGKRQRTYLEALETLQPKLGIQYGKYLISDVQCPICLKIYKKANEKMSDVNIATNLLVDAFKDNFDVAILISGDSDLSGPIVKVRQLFPDKKIIMAFPPDRSSVELKKRANAYFMIGERNLSTSQFPENVTSRNGYPLRRPTTWY
jgi:uncharacterized LabA/DUF88 family protein